MSLLNTTTLYLYGPLEQFDEVTWILYNNFFENTSSYFGSILELEYTWKEQVSNLSYANSKFFVYSLLLIFFLLKYLDNTTILNTEIKGISDNPTIASIMTFLKKSSEDSNSNSLVALNGNPFKEFNALFFVGIIHLLTGGFITLWFVDFVSASVDVSWVNDSLTIQAENFKNINNTTNSNDIYSYVFHFFPSIDFSIGWDENLISFLAVFFLLGGSEEEEDEDFFLEEKEGDFVDTIVAPLFISNLGKNVEDNGALFLKVSSIFSFVLINNLIGMFPYSDTATSSLILTFWVALSIFISLLTLMFRKQGFGYFLSLFLPAGCPFLLIFLLIPLELISYSFRVVSISVRLFANMMAGHTLLKIIVTFSWAIAMAGDLYLILHVLPVLLLFVLIFLEIGVAFVQAYIFTVLTIMYLKDVFVAH